jgi:peptidoglycan-N-acetylglucosamine deacetylase
MNPSDSINLKPGAPPTSNKSKPLASISLDLDNQWSYMKTHGEPGWESFPSYLNIFVPHVLDLLDRLNLKITFFVVGQDAALDKNKNVLKLLTERGHEVGNHSFHHEPWLHLYDQDQIRKEILETEDRIIRVTGQKPMGFRGPGFSWSSDLFKVLLENNYIYDASTLPTYIGPLARMYYFWTSSFTKEEKSQRNGLFGGFRDGFKPVKPYLWGLDSNEKLLEIPVTSIPIIKTPFHLSYLLYLSRFSWKLMSSYLTVALTLCRATGTQPSFLLHPLDLLGGDQVPELRFFPGMDLPSQRKIEIFEKVLKELAQHFTLANMSTHAKSILKRNDLKVISLPEKG